MKFLHNWKHLSKFHKMWNYNYLFQAKVHKLKIFNKDNNAGRLNILAKKHKNVLFLGSKAGKHSEKNV